MVVWPHPLPLATRGHTTPITHSIVSDRRLGEKPVNHVWCNRLVRLAHGDEEGAVLRDPERYVAAALDNEVPKAQQPT